MPAVAVKFGYALSSGGVYATYEAALAAATSITESSETSHADVVITLVTYTHWE